MRNNLFSFARALLLTGVLSSPTPTKPEDIAERQLLDIPAKITAESQIESIAAGLQSDAAAFSAAASVLAAALENIVPSPAPASIPDALSSVASVYAAHPTDFVANVLGLALNGLTTNDLQEVVSGEGPLENSGDNINPINPTPAVYPKKDKGDAPYSVAEKTLRSAIYIPSNFTYGKVPPVLLIPGTAGTSGANFAPNFGKLFTGSDYADPVYVNIPGNNLADIQVEAEFVAYAINYISGISNNKNVSLLSWSAGSVDGQWAMTYWPSTRSLVSNFIAISADFHGTDLAYLIWPGFPQNPCPPAVLQQEYNSTFIATLRNAGGSSAYVPTTSVYSAFDQIVQPQQGTGASAFILDERQVGVSNTELQNTCTTAQPGGTLYFHETVLFSALAFALAKDALTNGGPGNLSRIDVDAECQKIAPDGLSLLDLLVTEDQIVIAAYDIVSYPNRTLVEPPIMGYAQKNVPAERR